MVIISEDGHNKGSSTEEKTSSQEYKSSSFSKFINDGKTKKINPGKHYSKSGVSPFYSKKNTPSARSYTKIDSYLDKVQSDNLSSLSKSNSSTPVYEINNDFKLKNFSKQFIYPTKDLQKGLQELIIFTENVNKRDIPNGSVWVYDKDVPYKPEILNSDVGCGITSAIIEGVDFDKKNINEIMGAVDSMGINIGQGNHFVNFTDSYDSENSDKSMIFLHSDFNKKNVLPYDFNSSKALEENAETKRHEFLEQLIKTLGVSGLVHKNWTHNSVEQKDDVTIYRKGSINLEKTDGEGIIAINPLEGIFSYAASFDKFYNSMQHGQSQENKIKLNSKYFDQLKVGGAIGYVPNENKFDHVYGPSLEEFRKHFLDDIAPISYSAPKLIVRTKF